MKNKTLQKTVWIIIVLVGFTTTPSVYAYDFLLNVDNDRITLKAENTPLELVLNAIEAQSNIRIQCFLKADDLVTAKLDNILMEEGLDLLLQRYNRAISYKAMPNNRFIVTDIFINSRSIKTDAPLHIRMPRQQESKPQESLTIYDLDHGQIALHNSNPLDNNPLNSMRGIDPLARFNHQTPWPDENGEEFDILPSPGELSSVHF